MADPSSTHKTLNKWKGQTLIRPKCIDRPVAKLIQLVLKFGVSRYPKQNNDSQSGQTSLKIGQVLEKQVQD